MAERQFTYKLKFEADRNSYEQIKKELTDLEKMATTALNQKGHIPRTARPLKQSLRR